MTLAEDVSEQTATETESKELHGDGELASESSISPHRRRKPWSRSMKLIRRVHLYAGLFLLPWVFLYGITGAMFNHQWLFPDVQVQSVTADALDDSPMADFPAPDVLAKQVVETMAASAGDATIVLLEDHVAEFTNDIMFEVHDDGFKHVVHIDPLIKTSQVLTRAIDAKEEPLLEGVHNIKLERNPLTIARESVPHVLEEVGVETKSKINPHGWTKLNFLASVNGESARITYVLKDGHVDVTRYQGEHGMTPRSFFMRLHTSHGQTPHWNGRTIWSFFIDIMAIAMVTWGVSGILMWWQIKRTRVIGIAVIAASVATAGIMYFLMMHFYATTLL